MDSEFHKRRELAKQEINRLDANVLHDNPEREAFFEAVYENADGDAASIPWADLAAKDKLSSWLNGQRKHSGRAIDIGCGLGDNAEALANAGYQTTGFDFSPRAIKWAKSRFPDSTVTYAVADLFDLPGEWQSEFDLVHECYTLQSIPSQTLKKSLPAIAGLIAPGGTLLVYTRTRPDGSHVDGPPWPLEESVASSFADFGLELIAEDKFVLERPDRSISHIFSEWRKPE